MGKPRLDKLLVDRGECDSREKAKALIMAGCVRVNGVRATKAGAPVDDAAILAVDRPEHQYVSRGALKLAAAIAGFGTRVDDRTCLDVGASTGGFTDYLLQHGARSVTAVDVGYGQLHWKLRSDPRVVVLERTNFRHLQPGDLPDTFDLIVVDASFISLRLLLPACLHFLAPRGEIVALVKPQFEVGKGEVGRGGVVRDADKRQRTIDDVASFAATIGLGLEATLESPVHGPKGNVESFVLLRRFPA